MTIMEPLPSLTERSREATRSAHSVSDALVLSKLAVAFTDPKLYALSLGCFWPVLKKLDELIAAAANENADLKPFADLIPRASRVQGFEADLQWFLGPDWKDIVLGNNGPEVAEYLAHLDAVAKEDPRLLIAPAWQFTAALCSGGQILKRRVTKAMALDGTQGTATYDFPERPGKVKAAYKEAVDALEEKMGVPEVTRWLEECVTTFRMNNRVIGAFRVGYVASANAAVQYAAELPLTVKCAAAGAVAVAFMGIYIATTFRWRSGN